MARQIPLDIDLGLSAGRYFTPTAPVGERELFAGRLHQVQSVIDVVNQQGQHAVLFGERGVGKTSLANMISKFLGTDPLVCPRVNCDGLDSFKTVWKKLFAEIDMVASSKEPGFSASSIETRVPASEYFEDDMSPNGVRRLLSKISRDILPILIVDEFDRLAPTAKGVFADLVKMLSDHSVNATVILVGVADSVNDLILEHQSVERALVQIRMPRMSQSEIERIINNGLEHLELRIARKAIRKIVLLAQGLPHYAHLLGLHSVRVMANRRSDEVTVADVDVAIQKALQNAQQSIRSDYHRATFSARKHNLFKEVLAACAISTVDDLGCFQASDVRRPMAMITDRDYGIPAFSRHLNSFCEDSRGCILLKTGTPRRYQFRFTNPLMQPFVIMQAIASGMIDADMLERQD